MTKPLSTHLAPYSTQPLSTHLTPYNTYEPLPLLVSDVCSGRRNWRRWRCARAAYGWWRQHRAPRCGRTCGLCRPALAPRRAPPHCCPCGSSCRCSPQGKHACRCHRASLLFVLEGPAAAFIAAQRGALSENGLCWWHRSSYDCSRLSVCHCNALQGQGAEPASQGLVAADVARGGGRRARHAGGSGVTLISRRTHHLMNRFPWCQTAMQRAVHGKQTSKNSRSIL